MTNLYEINKWLIIATTLLYFTFWGGIIAHMILGAIQVIMSISIIVHFNKQTKMVRTLFISYVITTVSILVLFRIIDYNSDGGLELIFIWMIITMLLALFHLYITYKIKISND